MVRKSKEEAEKTRQAILDAARQVFSEQGVSRTSLAQIAKVANVTRGAIYWHFQNKTELFFAMKEQIPLPLLDQNHLGLPENQEQDALAQIEQFLLGLIQNLEDDESLRNTFEIMHFKCEYVDEFATVHQTMMTSCCSVVGQLEQAYEKAATQLLLKQGLDPRLCALESFILFSGLVRFWLADHQGSLIRPQVQQLIQNHLLSRRN